MSVSAGIFSVSFIRSPDSLLLRKVTPLASRGHGVSAAKRGFSRRLVSCKSQLAGVAPAVSAVYGTLLFGGGVFAFLRSGSKGSLAGGISGAVLMATSYFLMQVPESKYVGDALGFGSAFIFSAVFGIRMVASRKLVPAGPLLGLSVCATYVFISAYLQDKI